jgi:hypothetical protein
LRKNCISDKAKQKKIQRSYYTPLYEAVKERTQGIKGRKMRRKRSSTVEPVWGTLMNFMAAKRINARGLAAANKVLIMASACYNLKKWMKFIITKATSNATVLEKAQKAIANFLQNFYVIIFKPITNTLDFHKSIITLKLILLKRFYCLYRRICRPGKILLIFYIIVVQQ